MLIASSTSRLAMGLLGLPDPIKENTTSSKDTRLRNKTALAGCLFAGALVCGNAALHLMSVPAVQMLKVGNVWWTTKARLGKQMVPTDMQHTTAQTAPSPCSCLVAVGLAVRSKLAGAALQWHGCHTCLLLSVLLVPPTRYRVP